ncbi:MAG TPA: hypothetical protein PKI11_01035 [Candidatus Hydrogenedentes bacterium]|nr:hypothetical protein [Candidatus Hydrogenedentota bacterium]HNT88168.1 hypothetical protein [Candidatus Hydrogenedentota bacterium]
MKRLIYVLAVAIVAGVCAGCNTMAGQPRFESAAISPAALQLGGSGLLTVKVKDKHGIITEIKGAVQGDPRYPLTLNDLGAEGDEKAGDGVWSLQVDARQEAPTGDFMMEFTAYRSDGVPVTIRSKDGGIIKLTAQVPVRIVEPVEPEPLVEAPAP